MLYSPLNTARRCIRVIRIHQGDDLPISCSFQTLELGDTRSLPFTALSYTWGPCEPTSTIEVDGCSIFVRQNLWSALYSIREMTALGTWQECGSQHLWVDAICIDQENVAERSQQVNLMSSIYAQASVVSVWLGEADLHQDSPGALEFIRGANHRLENPSIVLEELSNQTSGPAILSLLNRQYWKRLWIVQEFILATDLVILCGNDFCRWSDLARLFRAIGAASLSSSFSGLYEIIDPILTSPAGQMVANRASWGSNPRRLYSLDMLLMMWPGQECEDRRDRIFGVLGLVSLWNSDLGPLSADYNKSLLQLFYDVIQQARQFYLAKSIDAKMGFTTSLMKALGIARPRRTTTEREQWDIVVERFHFGEEDCAPSLNSTDVRDELRRAYDNYVDYYGTFT